MHSPRQSILVVCQVRAHNRLLIVNLLLLVNNKVSCFFAFLQFDQNLVVSLDCLIARPQTKCRLQQIVKLVTVVLFGYIFPGLFPAEVELRNSALLCRQVAGS